MKRFITCGLTLFVLAATSSRSDSAVPKTFEIEVGVVVGSAEVARFRGDTMTISGLMTRARSLAGNSIVGLTCYPDGSDKNFTMFDAMAGGKLTVTAKEYGATERSTLQALCMAHHSKYHGR